MSTPPTGRTDELNHESPSVAVVRAVANQRTVDPIELPPLYDWIDPDALDALFEPTGARGDRRGSVTFSYDGHRIVVERADVLLVTVDGSAEVEIPSVADVGDFRSDV